jgi:hypothetical protein
MFRILISQVKCIPPAFFAPYLIEFLNWLQVINLIIREHCYIHGFPFNNQVK